MATNRNDISSIVKEIVLSYQLHGGINHIEGCILPSQDSVKEIIDILMNIFFPGFFTKEEIHKDKISEFTTAKVENLNNLLFEEISKSLNFQKEYQALAKNLKTEKIEKEACKFTMGFLNKIPAIRNVLKTDVKAFFESDPAAASQEEVIVSYPGIYAISVYRAAHELYKLKVPLIPRIMTEYAHGKTGIDIHPGATIDEYFFIDHGTGIVIGETTIIGKQCRIYQGVTLGALKIEFERDEQGNVIENKKRHPTLEDDVTIYAGATILGGRTILKKGTVIGGNAWVTSTTEEGAKIVYDTTNSQKVLKNK
jgi:serine O-acetyltransferase